ncbi:AraC family transcriptional regulator ligand-binding domain-containing protein [Pseudoalteromonas sp. SG43-7]|uniref:AraC family transcriptional regulator n=1 Tax=Pseudoalteromonas sp. SG43-7 TaxID=2760966 RepID=UPI001600AA76|nr:AraC family transcriptional regulator [Pseudoalteromonas sp. SG43-7]MBB1420503.1 AraC family transcriptional regulator ligand-binding domain-containing protein [Pseudoalteromonas sp. SG43-7]
MKTLADHYFSSCLDYLQSKGLDSQEILTAIEFDEYTNKQTQQLAPRISLKSYNALLSYAQQMLNDSLFGFELGKQIRTADFGVLGYLIESSTNLASAITALLSYDSLVANIGRAEFEQQQTLCKVTWLADPQCSPQAVLRNMTAWVSVIRQLLNPQLSPSCVYFTARFSDSELQQLARWFNCPVKAGANFNQVEFPSSYLTLPFKTDNSQINAVLKQMSEQRLSQFKSQQLLTEKINHILMAKHDLQECTLIRTASVLNMTQRTLQRRLKKEHKTFAAVLEAERKRRLPLYINQYPLSTIAFMLGFNDQSSFNRAFKRWYNINPRDYIKKHSLT